MDNSLPCQTAAVQPDDSHWTSIHAGNYSDSAMVEWGQRRPLGNYFVALISKEHKGSWHWSLLPFVLIWVGFGVLVLVSNIELLDKSTD